jgi:hypothetical protein
LKITSWDRLGNFNEKGSLVERVNKDLARYLEVPGEDGFDGI